MANSNALPAGAFYRALSICSYLWCGTLSVRQITYHNGSRGDNGHRCRRPPPGCINSPAWVILPIGGVLILLEHELDHDLGFDVSITIGGDAGQGIESSGAGFAKALARAGIHVFTMADYRSRIRGGHNFYQIRAAGGAVYSHSDPVDILIALTEETVKIHVPNVRPGGVIVYDEGFRRVDADEIARHDAVPLPLPLAETAGRLGSKVMMNTMALGVAAGLLGFPTDTLETVIKDNFAVKSGKIVDANIEAVRQGHRWGWERRDRLEAKLPKPRDGRSRLAVNGNQAFSLGAAAGGCRFVSAYPMTPGTSIFEWMVAHGRRLGIVTKHAEDEIAAMCMAVGAGHAGARALVPTSGGGFALMVEALGLAGMVEVPVVIALSQRGGPSTGLPTRTEQGDLLFAIHASQGEFPRVVTAPGSIEQCFQAGWRAFNLAEKYQCPVIVLLDQFLSTAVRTVDRDALAISDVEIDRGQTLTARELGDLANGRKYLRHRVTDSGISPRAIPGHPAAVYSLTSDEHDEAGHITEELENRINQMSKRMRKMDTALAEIKGPDVYGTGRGELSLVCWGSTLGPALEGARLLSRRGLPTDVIHFTDLWPFPAEQAQIVLQAARRTVCIEQNYTGQLARLVRMMTGFTADAVINKYDGRPFTPGDIEHYVLQEMGAGLPARKDGTAARQRHEMLSRH